MPKKEVKTKAKTKAKTKKVQIDKTYCGIGNMPRGKDRASAEYCMNHNQIRYYGMKAVDPKLLERVKTKKLNIDKERIKLKKIDLDADDLIKEYTKIKKILDNPAASTPAEVKRAKKKRLQILKKKETIKKKFIAQKNIVLRLAREEEREEAKRIKDKKNAKKAKTSKTKSSRSKTKKPKSHRK